MTEGTPAMTMTLPIQKPGALEIRIGDQLGAMRNARHAAARFVEVFRLDPLQQKRDGARVFGNPDAESASATASAVMSSCVGPMPPVVKT